MPALRPTPTNPTGRQQPDTSRLRRSPVSDPTGEAYEECWSGQYNCTYGPGGTGDLKKVEFGKNYEKVTNTVGGTISPNYTIQQNTGYKHVYTKGSGVTGPTVAQRARSAEVEHQKKVVKLRKAAEVQHKQNQKEEGFWESMKSSASDEWETFKGNVINFNWWSHIAVDMAVGLAALAGTAACIASVVCGAGLFAVGASALFVAGIGAHLAVATEEERRQGGAQFMLRTAYAEVRGIAFGALLGRGQMGFIQGGGNLFYARWAVKGGHARINSMVTGPRQGGLPLLWRRAGLFK